MGASASTSSHAEDVKHAAGTSSLSKVLMPLYYTDEPITEIEKAAAKKTFNLIAGNQCQRFTKYKEEHPNTECKTAMQFTHDIFFQRLFHVHPSCKGMFPNGTKKMDLFPVLAIFFAKMDQPEALKTALGHFVEVHTRIGVKAVECKFCFLFNYCL